MGSHTWFNQGRHKFTRLHLHFFEKKTFLSSLFNTNMPAGKGITEPKKLSEDLADICGVEVASRGECMKHLFAYIKENGLKDPEDGRFFIPDKKMAKIFGNEKLRSFGMSKFIGEHLSKIDDE